MGPNIKFKCLAGTMNTETIHWRVFLWWHYQNKVDYWAKQLLNKVDKLPVDQTN